MNETGKDRSEIKRRLQNLNNNVNFIFYQFNSIFPSNHTNSTLCIYIPVERWRGGGVEVSQES